MRAIKALVIFMGILLIGGLGLVGYGLYSKASKLSKKPADQAAAVTAPAAAEGNFGTQTIALPPGSRIEAVNSTANRVILHVAGPDGSSLVIVDPASGAVTGTVLLKPEAPAAR